MNKQILLILMISVLFTSCTQKADISMYTGTLEATIHTISTPVSDRLLELLFHEGEAVNKDDLLAVLDNTSISLEKMALEAGLERLQYQSQDASVRLKQLKEAWKHDRSVYERNLVLLEQKAVSEQTVNDLKLKVDTRQTDMSSLMLQEKSLKSSRKELEKKRELLDFRISQCRLNSPLSGRIENIFYEPGEYVPPLSPIMEIQDSSRLWCYIYAGDEVLENLREGQIVKAFTRSREYTGIIEFIRNKAEFTPREVLTPDNRATFVYGIKIVFDNTDGFLKSGMPIDIFLEENN